MAHEVAHIRHRDIWVMTLADTISRITSMLCLFGLILIFAFSPFLLLSEQGLPWVGLILLAVIPNVTTLLQLGLSRTREFDADLAAVELTHDPQALASALAKIEGPQFSWLSRIFLPRRQDPNPSLLRTHPPVEERIERLKALITPHPARYEFETHRIPKQFVVVTRKPRRHWNGF